MTLNGPDKSREVFTSLDCQNVMDTSSLGVEDMDLISASRDLKAHTVLSPVQKRVGVEVQDALGDRGGVLDLLQGFRPAQNLEGLCRSVFWGVVAADVD